MRRLSASMQPIRRITANIMTLLCLGILLFSSTSLALAKETSKIAIIDPQAVIEKSKAGSRALATLKEHAQARENVLKADQKELEDLQTELRKLQSTNDKSLKSKQEVFTRKFQDFQKRGQEYQQELGQKQKELVQEYMKKIEAATAVVAQRHGFTLVIDKGSETTLKIVLYAQRGLDITSEVVKEFDKRYK
ncbi:MAG: OmpH family outer membrane protein [Nitrospirales bacterium]|nr:OmpH family outer membrane protein [Nitrospira sp.]MDR4502597.1 OmpH family outer membrane protein [Nitrospirales bacterium]